MYIVKILSRSRRNLRVLLKCESCDEKFEGHGWDDDNYHQNVLPNMKCPTCFHKAPADYVPRKPKYAADEAT